MAQILDVRTRKLSDELVEAIAITDGEDAEGAPVVIRGYGATPDEAIADARAKAEA
jgi:F420-0:gamma-glutamyl ligase